MYTTVLHVIIYQLTKYETDPIKNDREIAERRYWERKKKKNKEKTIQQQKGLPTLSEDLNKKEKTIQQQKGLPTLSADLKYRSLNKGINIDNKYKW